MFSQLESRGEQHQHQQRFININSSLEEFGLTVLYYHRLGGGSGSGGLEKSSKMLTKFESKSARVKGLSFHPKRPWILAR